MAQQTLIASIANAGINKPGAPYSFSWNILYNNSDCTNLFFIGQQSGNIQTDPENISIIVEYEPNDCDWMVILYVVSISDPDCFSKYYWTKNGAISEISYNCISSSETPVCIPTEGLSGNYVDLDDCINCMNCSCNDNPCGIYDFTAIYTCDESDNTNGTITLCNVSAENVQVTISSITISAGGTIWNGNQVLSINSCFTFEPFIDIEDGTYFLFIEVITDNGCIVNTSIFVDCGPTVEPTNIDCCTIQTYKDEDQGQGIIKYYTVNLIDVVDNTQPIYIDFATNSVADKIAVYDGNINNGLKIGELPYVGDPLHCSASGTAESVIEGFLEVNGIFTTLGGGNVTQTLDTQPVLTPIWSLPTSTAGTPNGGGGDIHGRARLTIPGSTYGDYITIAVISNASTSCNNACGCTTAWAFNIICPDCTDCICNCIPEDDCLIVAETTPGCYIANNGGDGAVYFNNDYTTDISNQEICIDCTGLIDLIIVFDGSGSAAFNYTGYKDYILTLLDNMSLNNTLNKIGIQTFGRNSTGATSLSLGVTILNVKNVINSLTTVKVDNHIIPPLLAAQNDLINNSNVANKIILVVSDGILDPSSNTTRLDIINQYQSIHNDNIRIMTLAVSNTSLSGNQCYEAYREMSISSAWLDSNDGCTVDKLLPGFCGTNNLLSTLNNPCNSTTNDFFLFEDYTNSDDFANNFLANLLSGIVTEGVFTHVCCDNIEQILHVECNCACNLEFNCNNGCYTPIVVNCDDSSHSITADGVTYTSGEKCFNISCGQMDIITLPHDLDIDDPNGSISTPITFDGTTLIIPISVISTTDIQTFWDDNLINPNINTINAYHFIVENSSVSIPNLEIYIDNYWLVGSEPTITNSNIVFTFDRSKTTSFCQKVVMGILGTGDNYSIYLDNLQALLDGTQVPTLLVTPFQLIRRQNYGEIIEWELTACDTVTSYTTESNGNYASLSYSSIPIHWQWNGDLVEVNPLTAYNIDNDGLLGACVETTVLSNTYFDGLNCLSVIPPIDNLFEATQVNIIVIGGTDIGLGFDDGTEIVDVSIKENLATSPVVIPINAVWDKITDPSGSTLASTIETAINNVTAAPGFNQNVTVSPFPPNPSTGNIKIFIATAAGAGLQAGTLSPTTTVLHDVTYIPGGGGFPNIGRGGGSIRVFDYQRCNTVPCGDIHTQYTRTVTYSYNETSQDIFVNVSEPSGYLNSNDCSTRCIELTCS